VSSPDSKAVAHGVQESSSVWAPPLVVPCNKAVPLSSSASWVSGEAALSYPRG
jgi:hypothetical protein